MFYDANHCPGAALVVLELPGSRTLLHTGDMRHHPKMKQMPQAAQQRRIDLVFLDTTRTEIPSTTTFVAQDVAVDAIASRKCRNCYWLPLQEEKRRIPIHPPSRWTARKRLS